MSALTSYDNEDNRLQGGWKGCARKFLFWYMYWLVTAMTGDKTSVGGVAPPVYSFTSVSAPGEEATTQLPPPTTLENKRVCLFSRTVFVCHKVYFHSTNFDMRLLTNFNHLQVTDLLLLTNTNTFSTLANEPCMLVCKGGCSFSTPPSKPDQPPSKPSQEVRQWRQQGVAKGAPVCYFFGYLYWLLPCSSLPSKMNIRVRFRGSCYSHHLPLPSKTNVYVHFRGIRVCCLGIHIHFWGSPLLPLPSKTNICVRFWGISVRFLGISVRFLGIQYWILQTFHI